MNIGPINRFVMRVGEEVITILDFLRFVVARKHRSTRASIVAIEMERHMTRKHCEEMADYFRACLANRDVAAIDETHEFLTGVIKALSEKPR